MNFQARLTFILLALFPLSLVSRGQEVMSDSIVAVELQELNIVAIKQSGALQSQALSSTVIDREEISINHITDIKKLSDMVPNFYLPDYGSRITSTIYVRGIGARMDQPSVGLTIDNMPVLNKDAYDLDIPYIAEIEMLRGPQSALYGRNTMTGLINIRTLSPLSYRGWKIQGEAMLNKSLKLQGAWFHKFRHDMGLSVAAGLNSIHGDYKNRYNGSEVGREKSGNLRLKFEWLPSSKISLTNTFSTSLLSQKGYAYEEVSAKEINYNDTCFYRRFLLNDVVSLNYNLNGWMMSGIFSVQHINDNMTLDQDFLPESYFNLTQKKQETDLTAEILAKRTGRHSYNWLGGVFGFYRHLDMQAPVTFKATGIEQLIEHYRNEANPYYPIKWNSDSFLLDSDFRLPSFGVAIYHESSYEVAGWKFTGALRLDYERVFLRYHSFTDTSYSIYFNPSGSLEMPFSEMEKYRDAVIYINDEGKMHLNYLTFLPKVSALYAFSSGLGNTYFTFGKGYKAGGYNTQMFSDVLQQRVMNIMGVGYQYDVDEIVKYKPEYSFNYEIGTHLDFSKISDRQLSKLTLDVSLFYIDCRDQQLTKFPEGNTTGRMMTNAGRTRSFGGEIEFSWFPTSRLMLNGSYGYTNARFLRYSDGKENYKGKRLPYAPENTFFLQALYTLAANSLGNKNILFDINLRGAGNIYWNETNTLKQPFYALLGASVTLKSPHWEIQLWGKNLTAAEYYTFYFKSMGNEFRQRGPKLNAGIVLRINI